MGTISPAGGMLGFQAKITYKNIHVLVIDDHGHIRKAMTNLLRVAGIRNIEEAHDVPRALKILKESKIDLILCDIYLEGNAIKHFFARELNTKSGWVKIGIWERKYRIDIKKDCVAHVNYS